MMSQAELLDVLKSQIAASGVTILEASPQLLRGEAEAIRAKWWFGGRKVSYGLSCRPTEADHTVHFREVVAERSWGIPPPTLTVETTTTSGWKRSGERTDVAPGGGGSLDYAKVRDAVEQSVTSAGWKFDLEAGRMP